MIEIISSPQLKSLSASLDDAWESAMVEKLPFPVAFHLKHLRNEKYPWDFLLKDMLHILLKYLAIVASSDYLHSQNNPDFDINEQLQNLRINMSEGHWLRLLRTCSTSKNSLLIDELKNCFTTVENGPYYARISWPETNIKSDNAGVLSTLVTIRNKLLGHGKSPSESDKQALLPQILGLLRSALYLYQPIWSYDLIYVFEQKKISQSLVLRGITNFTRPDLPEGSFPSKCFLALKNQVAVNLFPLVLSDKPKLASQVTLIDLQSEQYILEHLDTNFNPEYIGISGANYKPANQRDELIDILENKSVWTKRQDIELGDIMQKLKVKTTDNLEDIEYNNIYKTNSYFHRKETEEFLNTFIEDKESRVLIVSGVSGCGKTTSIMHFVNSLLNSNKHVLLIRAIELPERVQKPMEFEQWIVEYLGYDGDFEDILEYAKSSGSGKLIIVLDGVNEFTAVGRDASKLFTNINHFLAKYRKAEVLKVMITIRSDTLKFFLPGGKLPVDALEELYFREGNRDYYEIGTLTEIEGMELLKILKVPVDKSRSILVSLKENMRTPQVLYKITSGAIAPEDLKGMDSLKITGKFLERRLDRDKDLKKLCLDLVGVMGKTKDMNLTEEHLSDKAPKLLTKLKANNNHLLNVLSDLEIIQQIKTEDNSGNSSSAILLSHDSIFEALSKGVDKSTKKFKNIAMAISLIMVIVGIFMMYVEKKDPNNPQMLAFNQKVDTAIIKFDSTVVAQYFTNPEYKLSPGEIAKIKSAYHELFNLYRFSEIEYRKMNDKFGIVPLLFMLAFFGLAFISQKLIANILSKIDKRESRIQFFGKNEKFKLLKFMGNVTVIVVICFLIIITILQFIGLKNKQVEILTIITFILYFLFLSIAIPSLLVYKTIKKCEKSQLINEYFLSKFGRYMIRLEHFFNFGIGIILFPLIILLIKIPSSSFYPEKEQKVLQSKIDKELSAIDLKIIKTYPVASTLPIHEFVSSEGQSLEKQYGQSMEEKIGPMLEKKVLELLPERMNGGKSNYHLTIIYLFVIFGLSLMTILINILPFEIAARKYYRSSS